MKNVLKSKYLWIGVALGLIIGDIAGVALFKEKGVSVASPAPVAEATSTPYAIEVAAQHAGSSVLVSSARVATTTWIAVRESNGDLLGRILGARRVPAGENKDVVVELLRPTLPHLMYAVVMYTDDGDLSFDNKLDALVEQDGSPVVFPFMLN